MAYYTSHIYFEPSPQIVEALQAHPVLSAGLYHLRQFALENTIDIAQNGLPEAGLGVIREICNSVRSDNNEEAQVHADNRTSIISWKQLKGPAELQVIQPRPIPTLAFGKIYVDHSTNRPPPVEFLQFLKHLSATYQMTVAFYHHYTAYEDRLADAEYAWVFGREEILYIRHVDHPYQTVRYSRNTARPAEVIDQARNNHQPVLQEVMRLFRVILAPPAYRPYFSSLNWQAYRLAPAVGLEQFKPVSALVDQLVSELSLRAWEDDAEGRSELLKEIVQRVKEEKDELESVLNLLNHADWTVRARAAEMLGWIGDPRVIGPLLNHLWRDRYQAVRGQIALVLERLGALQGEAFPAEAAGAARAAAQEYAQMIRAYPEVTGTVNELAQRLGRPASQLFEHSLYEKGRGIIIEDMTIIRQGSHREAYLAFDLAGLLSILGRLARDAQWCCRGVECSGPSADELHAVSDQGLIISGRTLSQIALNLQQMIEGEFVALSVGGETWLLIRAVDSSWFEVWASDPALLEKIRSHFRRVRNIDDSD